jgi:ABC-type sugar transport system substrate-binding protein
VRQALGWTVERTVTACIDDDRFGSALADALRAQPDAVAVVAPAAQNPIVAIAGFLQALADAVEPGREVVVLLAGAPGELDTRRMIWSRFVALHRLRAGVETCR